MAEMMGLLTVRLADSIILPFNFTSYGEELLKYVDELECLAALSRDTAVNFARKTYQAVSANVSSASFGDLDFLPLRQAARYLEKRGGALEHQIHLYMEDCIEHMTEDGYDEDYFRSTGGHPSKHDQCRKRRKTINHHLRKAEQHFIDQDGIPTRPWFKHGEFTMAISSTV